MIKSRLIKSALCSKRSMTTSAASIPDLKISVSEITDFKLSKFCESVESGHSSQDDNSKIASILGIIAKPIRKSCRKELITTTA